MRQYAWYSPQLNCIVFQTIMDDCPIMFEWDPEVLVVLNYYKVENPMTAMTWIPLGEL